MGIQKIGNNNSSCSALPCSSSSRNKRPEDDPVLIADTRNTFDDLEPSELGCELGLVEGHICSIPYELYVLPSLREILSLETWNSCLTEEERFRLSVHLPDMDQKTFHLTMKEIFGGNDLFFGNPVETFFKRLKGGLYQPQVAFFRETLQFMHRKKYYHSLRAYHQRMIRTLVNMRSIWGHCQLTPDVDKSFSIWAKKRKQGDNDLLDLNRTPEDDHHMLSEVANLNSKGIKSEDKKGREIVLSLPVVGDNLTSSKGRAKRVSKLALPGNDPFQIQIPSSDVLQRCSVPKGVVKVVPRAPSFPIEPSEDVQRAQPIFPTKTIDLNDLRFSSLPASLYFRDDDGLFKLPYLQQKAKSRNSSMDQPECVLNQQDNSIVTRSYLDSSFRIAGGEMTEVSATQHKLFGADVDGGLDKSNVYSIAQTAPRRLGYAGESQSTSSNMGKETKDFLQSSFSSDGQHQEKQQMYPLESHRVSDYPRTPDRGTNSKDKKPTSSSTNLCLDVAEHVRSKSVLSESSKDKNSQLLTYKRRKALLKLDSPDLHHPLMAAPCSNSSTPKEPS